MDIIEAKSKIEKVTSYVVIDDDRIIGKYPYTNNDERILARMEAYHTFRLHASHLDLSRLDTIHLAPHICITRYQRSRPGIYIRIAYGRREGKRHLVASRRLVVTRNIMLNIVEDYKKIYPETSQVVIDKLIEVLPTDDFLYKFFCLSGDLTDEQIKALDSDPVLHYQKLKRAS